MHLQDSYLTQQPIVDYKYEKTMITVVESFLKGYQYLENCCEISQPSYRRWLFEELNLMPNSKVLDYGCAVSHFWVKNSDRLDISIDYHLIEPSKIGVKLSQKYVERISQHVNLNQMSLFDLRYNQEYFDTIISETAFLILDSEKQKKALNEVSRVLKPQGTFYALISTETHLELLDEFYGKFKFGFEKELKPLVGEVFRDAEGTLFQSITLKKHKAEYLIKDCRTFINLFFTFNSSLPKHNQIMNQRQLDTLKKTVQKVIDEKGGILLERHFYVAICQK